jgi:hypothetical protein
VQASAYLLPNQHKAFVAYAHRVGLIPSQLLALLILREITTKEMFADSAVDRRSAQLRQPWGQAVERRKVTARLTRRDTVEAFQAYMRRFSLGSTQMATQIAIRELRDRRVELFVRGEI